MALPLSHWIDVPKVRENPPALRRPGFGDLAGPYAPPGAMGAQMGGPPPMGFLDLVQTPQARGLWDSLMNIGAGMMSVRPGSGDLSPIGQGILNTRGAVERQQILDRRKMFRDYLHSRMGQVEPGSQQMDLLQAAYAYGDTHPGLLPHLLDPSEGSWMDKLLAEDYLTRARQRDYRAYTEGFEVNRVNGMFDLYWQAEKKRNPEAKIEDAFRKFKREFPSLAPYLTGEGGVLRGYNITPEQEDRDGGEPAGDYNVPNEIKALGSWLLSQLGIGDDQSATAKPKTSTKPEVKPAKPPELPPGYKEVE